MFCGYLTRWSISRRTHKIQPGTWLFSFLHVLLTCPFRGLLFSRTSCELVAKLHWFFISYLILHQLNTKPNTIKSHKIQGTKLMQLQHFLSWNKVNIKHNYKSQLYSFFSFFHCHYFHTLRQVNHCYRLRLHLCLYLHLSSFVALVYAKLTILPNSNPLETSPSKPLGIVGFVKFKSSGWVCGVRNEQQENMGFLGLSAILIWG